MNEPVLIVQADAADTVAACKRIRVLHYDGPYGYNYRSNHRAERLDPVANDSAAEAYAILHRTGQAAETALAPGGSMLVWTACQHEECVDILAQFNAAHPALRQVGKGVWDKRVFGTGWGFRYQHEDVFHFCNGKLAWHTRRTQGDVFSYPRPKVENGSNATPKPVPVLQYWISPLAQYGDLVVDPVCGGGSFAVAAWKLGFRVVLGDILKSEVERAAARLTHENIPCRIVSLADIEKEFAS